MNAWDQYLINNIVDGQHKKFPGWRPTAVWTFHRDKDGVITHHKADTPYGFWESACEESMAMWERLYPDAVPDGQGWEAYDKVSRAMAEAVKA